MWSASASGRPFDLVVEREQFAGFGSVHPDRFAFAGDFSVVDFAFAFGGKIGAGTHGEGGGNHAGEAGEENILAVAGGSARDAGDDAEDGAESVVDAVDGIADPGAGLLAALAAFCEKFVENGLGVDGGCARRGLIVAAEERTEFAVVVFLVFDYVVKDGNGAFVAEVFQLLAIVGNVAAFFDFEATQGHADAAGAVGERIGFSAKVAGVLRLRATKLDDAAMPEGGVLPFGAGQVTQHLCADGVGVAIGEGFIGVVALHLGLPIGFERGQNFFQLGAAERGGCHFASPCVLLRIRHFEWKSQC